MQMEIAVILSAGLRDWIDVRPPSLARARASTLLGRTC